MQSNFALALADIGRMEIAKCRGEMAQAYSQGAREELITFLRGNIEGVERCVSCSVPEAILAYGDTQSNRVEFWAERATAGDANQRDRLTYLWHLGQCVGAAMVLDKLRLQARQ